MRLDIIPRPPVEKSVSESPQPCPIPSAYNAQPTTLDIAPVIIIFPLLLTPLTAAHEPPRMSHTDARGGSRSPPMLQHPKLVPPTNLETLKPKTLNPKPKTLNLLM